MVATPEMLSDRFERILGEYLRQIHGDLTSLNDLTLPGLLKQFVVRYIEELADHFLDRLDGDLLGGCLDEIPEDFLGEFQIDLALVQG